MVAEPLHERRRNARQLVAAEPQLLQRGELLERRRHRPRQLVVVEPQLLQRGELPERRRHLPRELVVAEAQLLQRSELPERRRHLPRQLVVAEAQRVQRGELPERRRHLPRQRVIVEVQHLQRGELPERRRHLPRQLVTVEDQNLQRGEMPERRRHLPRQLVVVEQQHLQRGELPERRRHRPRQMIAAEVQQLQRGELPERRRHLPRQTHPHQNNLHHPSRRRSVPPLAKRHLCPRPHVRVAPQRPQLGALVAPSAENVSVRGARRHWPTDSRFRGLSRTVLIQLLHAHVIDINGCLHSFGVVDFLEQLLEFRTRRPLRGVFCRAALLQPHNRRRRTRGRFEVTHVRALTAQHLPSQHTPGVHVNLFVLLGVCRPAIQNLGRSVHGRVSPPLHRSKRADLLFDRTDVCEFRNMQTYLNEELKAIVNKANQYIKGYVQNNRP
jgi:hypothetical protein